MTNETYAIVFDLDGVLLDSESNMIWMKQALIETLKSFNITPTERNLSMLDRNNLLNFPEVADFFNINEKELWKRRNYHYTKRKTQAIIQEIILPFPDIKSLYDLPSTVELAILSNSPQEVVDIYLKKTKLNTLFTAGIGRSRNYEDIFKLKPHPLLWQKLKPKLTASSFLYVGDRRTDQLFAEKMNITFFGLNRYHHVFENGFSSLYEIVNKIQTIIYK